MAPKRKSDSSHPGNTKKKQKACSANWQTPKQSQWTKDKEIHIGDAGIWVTCVRNREAKCATEVMDLLEEYASKLYDNSALSARIDEDVNADDEASPEIEDIISSEISTMKETKSTGLFKVIRPDIVCVLFIKTRKPVDPVVLVHSICKDVAAGLVSRSCRYVKRLTPATWTEKAHEKNFNNLIQRIIEPVFHGANVISKKYAIRFTSRNHHIFTRDEVIQKTAALVGDRHKVDLEHPDLVILVEVYKTICTMAVVDGEYLALKRYNLAELGNATDQGENSVPTRVAKDTTNSALMQGENPQAN
ncbi:MAG: hypothetical protein GOMPHAMPRED_001392 [Gomphillus americanus]|uniref:THUMP domain-containing protein n=1 Tax=Gomphillus americanus TaxID=1940652 RepID=A0A8H3FBP0_9LECA|nr:MAG: hypothetical protein GOMPHAMPRED_001392 [Gomphillus americanus]